MGKGPDNRSGLKNYKFHFILLFFISMHSGVLFAQTWNWEKIADFYDTPEITLSPNGNIYMSVFNASSVLYRVSSDTGKTWNTKSVECSDYISRRIVFNFKNDIFIVCRYNQQSLVLRTINNEISWDTVYAGAEIFSLFIDRNNVLYIGNWKGEVYSSTNNGNSWVLNKIAKTYVSTFAQSNDGTVFAGTDKGIFYTRDAGNKWALFEGTENTSTYTIYLTKRNWIIRSDPFQTSISYDYGKQWQNSDLTDVASCFEAEDGRVFACGTQGVFYLDTLLSKWVKKSGFSNAVRMLQVGDLFMVGSGSGVYVYDSKKIPYIGKNYFPLNKGNKWQYIIFSHNEVTTNYKYFMVFDSVYADTTINFKTYYKTLYEPNLWLRYSDQEKKAYAYANGKDNLFMDFNLNDGSIINQYCGGTDIQREAKIGSGYVALFNKSIHYKEFKHYYSYGMKGGVISTAYAEEIGPISHGIGFNLIQAVFYEGDTVRNYSKQYTPKITLNPISKVVDSMFYMDFVVSHPYSLISLSYYYGDNEVCFIDTVMLSGFYKKEDTIITIPNQWAKRTEFTSNFNFSFSLNLHLLKTGYSFYYKIYAKDKGIIPTEKCSPDSGYYKLDYTSEPLGVNKTQYSGTINELENCFPNPANSSTRFTYTVPFEAFINITLYNSLGQAVKEIVNGYMIPGIYKATINCDQLPSGIYYYRLNSGKYRVAKKLIIIK